MDRSSVAHGSAGSASSRRRRRAAWTRRALWLRSRWEAELQWDVHKSEEEERAAEELVERKESKEAVMLDREMVSNYNAQPHLSGDFVQIITDAKAMEAGAFRSEEDAQ